MADWEDYIDFDIEDIREIAGDDAATMVQDTVQDILTDLLDAYDYASSEDETEMAEAALDEFMFTMDEALGIAEEFELEYLTEQMSQSYKDQDIIDRYLELMGYGRSGGGGGGGSSPTLTAQQELERMISNLEREIASLKVEGQAYLMQRTRLEQLQKELDEIINPKEDDL